MSDEREWPGWGEDDWDDETVRNDLLRLVATYDGTRDEALIARRGRQVRMWAASEAARARNAPRDADVTLASYADDSSPAGEATEPERNPE